MTDRHSRRTKYEIVTSYSSSDLTKSRQYQSVVRKLKRQGYTDKEIVVTRSSKGFIISVPKKARARTTS